MAKQKKQIEETKNDYVSQAASTAWHQKVGYMPADEYATFKALCAKAHLKIVETKMGNVIKVTVEGKKFYTDL